MVEGIEDDLLPSEFVLTLSRSWKAFFILTKRSGSSREAADVKQPVIQGAIPVAQLSLLHLEPL